jgi:hypothetical protein
MHQIHSNKKWLDEAFNNIELLHSMRSEQKMAKKNYSFRTPDNAVGFLDEDYLLRKWFPFKNEISMQTRILWQQSILKKHPTVWFFHYYDVSKAMIAVLCDSANISLDQLLDGTLGEGKIQKILQSAAYLSSYPMRICEAHEPTHFTLSVDTFATIEASCSVVCDWVFSREELELARKIARKSKITFLCPGPIDT